MNPYLIPLIELFLRRRDQRRQEKAKAKESKMDIDRIEQQLIRDEGMRLTVYNDHLGNPTIGVGRLLSNGIRESEAMNMLRNDVNECIQDCFKLGFFKKLNEPRQAVIVNMRFNLGLTRLLTFKKMLAALDRQDFSEAAKEMGDSLWSKQVGVRAIRLQEQLLKGEWVN